MCKTEYSMGAQTASLLTWVGDVTDRKRTLTKPRVSPGRCQLKVSETVLIAFATFIPVGGLCSPPILFSCVQWAAREHPLSQIRVHSTKSKRLGNGRWALWWETVNPVLQHWFFTQKLFFKIKISSNFYLKYFEKYDKLAYAQRRYWEVKMHKRC